VRNNGVLIIDDDAAYYQAELQAAFPDRSFHAAKSAEEAIDLAPEHCDVLVARPRLISSRLFRRMTRLKWVQSTIAGVDAIVALDVPRDVIITSARGAHGAAMSELAILNMLALSRRYPQLLANQRARRWEKWEQSLLFGKTVVTIGVGVSAQALAVRCGAFGMTVLGVSSRRSAEPGFQEIFPRDKLLFAVEQADFLICLVAYSPATHHMVDRPVFEAMKASGFFLNQSRGSIVNEQALMEALTAGRFAGAALDVFEQEPLSASNRFWEMDNVIITPHIGGFGSGYAHHVLPIVRENLEAYFNGGVNAIRPLDCGDAAR
jgi:phosphoglycerate dehydrogenase-like enzyme